MGVRPSLAVATYPSTWDTERRDRGEISRSTDCCRNPRGITCVQTLRAEIPLLRVNGQENQSPAEAGLAALGRAPGLFSFPARSHSTGARTDRLSEPLGRRGRSAHEQRRLGQLEFHEHRPAVGVGDHIDPRVQERFVSIR